MPIGREAATEEQGEEESVFLSPEWDPSQERSDQGASPQLRRSARKRKSTADEDQTVKGTSSNKKKMPKVPRSPQQTQQGQSFEALLLAMEGRLTAKLEKASEASQEAAQQAKLNCEGLEQLESRVDANEACLMTALQETEVRIMNRVEAHMQEIVQGKIRDMVAEQLTAAGFDNDLTAADLSLRRSAMQTERTTSYASLVAGSRTAESTQPEPKRTTVDTRTKEDRRESKFWAARRSLRLWPIPEGSRTSLEDYLESKLRLDRSFIEEELGQVILTRVREPKNKNKDEFVATFESKQIRDEVKAAASNLANHRDTAGMKLHVPDHLQKDFQALMNLSYDLKKKHQNLKRNIKFDEEDGGLFMDLKVEEGAEWIHVKPAQALAANKKRGTGRTRSTNEGELRDLRGEDKGGED